MAKHDPNLNRRSVGSGSKGDDSHFFDEEPPGFGPSGGRLKGPDEPLTKKEKAEQRRNRKSRNIPIG